MKEKLTGCLVLFLLILLVPSVITLLLGREITLPVSGQSDVQSPQVDVGESGKTIDLQEYLIGVTAAQLPGNYSLEAVKAQMILNRTYYYSVLGGGTNLSAQALELTYLSETERTARWSAEGCENAEEIFRQAAVETEGQVMTCQRELAVGMYHPASAGKTRDLSDSYPYLCSVDSEYDLQMDGYLTVVEYSCQSLIQKLASCWDTQLTEASLKNSLQILERDEGGYVESLLIGTEIVEGAELVTCLNLPSAAFTFQWPEEDRLSIVCRGIGHGYGMSQYGADCLAREGKTALQILQYYFQNVTVETWKRGE